MQINTSGNSLQIMQTIHFREGKLYYTVNFYTERTKNEVTQIRSRKK